MCRSKESDAWCTHCVRRMGQGGWAEFREQMESIRELNGCSEKSFNLLPGLRLANQAS